MNFGTEKKNYMNKLWSGVWKKKRNYGLLKVEFEKPTNVQTLKSNVSQTSSSF